MSSVPSSEYGFEISYAALSIGNTGHTSANITIIVAERAMGTAQQMDFPMFSIPSLTASVRSILLAISCDRFSASWMLFYPSLGQIRICALRIYLQFSLCLACSPVCATLKAPHIWASKSEKAGASNKRLALQAILFKNKWQQFSLKAVLCFLGRYHGLIANLSNGCKTSAKLTLKW